MSLSERVQVASRRCPWLRDHAPAMGGEREKGAHARRQQLPFRWEWLRVEERHCNYNKKNAACCNPGGEVGPGGGAETGRKMGLKRAGRRD
jgi:hypothetical protein